MKSLLLFSFIIEDGRKLTMETEEEYPAKVWLNAFLILLPS